MGPCDYALIACFSLIVTRRRRNFVLSLKFQWLVCVIWIIFEFRTIRSRYEVLVICTWSQARRTASTKRNSNIEKNTLSKATSGHDELIRNVKRKVVDTFYKSLTDPKVELQNIDQRVENLTGVRKLIWDEWGLMLPYVHKWPDIIFIQILRSL